MKIFLVLNPGSHSGRSKRMFDEIFKLLDSFRVDFDYKITDKLDDAYLFSRHANSLNYDAIVAVGGDGTINQVINGFYDTDGVRNSKSSFGVIYTGTSPDFCQSYNVPLKLSDAVRVIANGSTRSIDIGRIVLSSNKILTDVQPSAQVKYFACCANIGLGATLAQRANSGVRKYLGDTIGTFVALLVTLATYKPVTYRCSFDNQSGVIDNCYNLSVGITPFIASGIKVPTNNTPINHFYIMGACNINLSNIIGVIKRVYSGKPFKNDNSLWIQSAQVIAIENNPSNSDVEFDGDPVGFLPCSITLAPQKLDVLVSDV